MSEFYGPPRARCDSLAASRCPRLPPQHPSCNASDTLHHAKSPGRIVPVNQHPSRAPAGRGAGGPHNLTASTAADPAQSTAPPCPEPPPAPTQAAKGTSLGGTGGFSGGEEQGRRWCRRKWKSIGWAERPGQGLESATGMRRAAPATHPCFRDSVCCSAGRLGARSAAPSLPSKIKQTWREMILKAYDNLRKKRKCSL